MALHIEVSKQAGVDNVLFVRAEWEDGKVLWEREFVPVLDKMTAAESVEFYMLDKLNMVASWSWSDERVRGQKVLHGQFVYAGRDGRPSYKEVSDSRASHFGL